MAEIDFSKANTVMTLVRYDIGAEKEVSPEEFAADLLPKDAAFKAVALGMIKGDGAAVAAAVNAAMAKADPLDVINKALVPGMAAVSKLYDSGVFFLPQVMISADAMAAGIKACEDKMGKAFERKATIVCHVAEGDIHDLGKVIAVALFNANGFNAIDLGRDVPVDEVVEAVEKYNPLMVTGTALMTTTMSAFPKIAERLKEKGIEIPFICGGGAVNREYVESYDMGIYADKVAQGPVLAEVALSGKSWKDIKDDYENILGV